MGTSKSLQNKALFFDLAKYVTFFDAKIWGIDNLANNNIYIYKYIKGTITITTTTTTAIMIMRTIMMIIITTRYAYVCI